MHGERFMDRIEYEEWALKAIDPALSPTPWSTPGTPKEGDDGKVSTRASFPGLPGAIEAGDRARSGRVAREGIHG